jgi:hypothetical protein
MALATTPLSELLPLVRPHVPGCPNPLIIQELRMAAIEFCERTKMWRERKSTSIFRQDRTVTVLDYAEIHEIETADFIEASGQSWRLPPVPFLSSNPDDREADTEQSIPIYITQSSLDTVSVIPFATGTLIVQAIMKPQSLPKYGVSGTTTLQAIQNVIPTAIASKYGETLAQGALARLLAIPGKRWAEPNLAMAKFTLFRAELDKLSNFNVHGQHRARARAASSWV